MFESFQNFLQIPADASIAEICIIGFLAVVTLGFFIDLIFFVLNQLRR